MKKKKLLILLLVIAIAAAALAVYFTQRGAKWDFPPMVLIGENYYKRSGASFGQLPEGAEYLGQILSAVPSNEKPEQTFQANDDIVGAPVYGAEDGVLIEIDGKWWEYTRLA